VQFYLGLRIPKSGEHLIRIVRDILEKIIPSKLINLRLWNRGKKTFMNGFRGITFVEKTEGGKMG
jgi:hypothetical protein